MSQLRVDPIGDGEDGRFRVDGELDISTVDTFTRVIGATAPGATISLDLDAMSFMDSSGLKALLHARSTGRELVLENVRPEPLRILEIAEVLDLFRIESNTL